MRAVAPDAPPFSWVREPVLNRLTRLAVEMCAAGVDDFAASGYECPYLKGQPEPATRDFFLNAASRRRSQRNPARRAARRSRSLIASPSPARESAQRRLGDSARVELP